MNELFSQAHSLLTASQDAIALGDYLTALRAIGDCALVLKQLVQGVLDLVTISQAVQV